MPTIRIPKLKKNLEVSPGTRLFDALRAADLPIASSCQGDIVCGRCKVVVESGNENLSPIDTAEQQMATRLKWEEDTKKPVRAACGASIESGSVEISTTYW